MIEPSIVYRPGSDEDAYSAFLVMERSLADLNKRLGSIERSSADDPELLKRIWQERKGLYQHLGQTADSFWLAERNGEAVGIARSIKREDLWMLTELFVLPSEQSSGVGKRLMSQVVSKDVEGKRSIISSPDARAQALYEGMGLSARFHLYYMWRQAERIMIDSSLTFVPMNEVDDHLAVLGSVDQVVLGHRREVDHEWLLSDREGYLVMGEGVIAGYGYFGRRNGPVALLDAADFPAVLAFGENLAADRGMSHFGIEVPAINESAMNYLRGRGFESDVLVALFLSDNEMGDFSKYVFTSPPFIL
jgi:GNAT superfamily N-acetyltransferase